MLEKAVLNLVGNIHGLDAAILALCIIVYLLFKKETKANEKAAIVAMIIIGVISVCLIAARVYLSRF